MSSEVMIALNDVIQSANTGLDAIKRAPIVEHDTGIKCLRIQDVSQSKKVCNWGFTDVADNNYSKFKLKENDIFIARTGGSIGVNSFIEKNHEAVFNNGLIRLRIDTKRHHPKFIYYLLQTDSFKQHIYSIAFSTAAQPNMKIRDLLDFKFLQLEKEHEIEIANILDCLDDRINLLRETNTTLEAIAQALFKSWFVDFNPVRAKQEGREPEGIDADTAAIFPDSFEESEMGLVPKGWRVGKVENLIELAYGKALKASDRLFGNVPVYGSGGITGYHNEPLVTGPSIVVGRKGTVGTLYWEDQPFFPIDTVFYVKAKAPLTYCFYQLKVLGLEGMNTDGAVPGLNRNNVYRLPIAIPLNSMTALFDDLVLPLRRRIFANLAKAQTLTTLRDTLLPRLISGQLRLPNAEVMVEEV